jgi:hypothetical protein
VKTRLLTLLIAIATFGRARAEDAALEFPGQRIDLPALSLSGAAKQALERRLSTQALREIRDAGYSNFFIVRKRGADKRVYSILRSKLPDRAGAKITIVPGMFSFDYKLNVVASEVEPSK